MFHQLHNSAPACKGPSKHIVPALSSLGLHLDKSTKILHIGLLVPTNSFIQNYQKCEQTFD